MAADSKRALLDRKFRKLERNHPMLMFAVALIAWPFFGIIRNKTSFSIALATLLPVISTHSFV